MHCVVKNILFFYPFLFFTSAKLSFSPDVQKSALVSEHLITQAILSQTYNFKYSKPAATVFYRSNLSKVVSFRAAVTGG